MHQQNMCMNRFSTIKENLQKEGHPITVDAVVGSDFWSRKPLRFGMIALKNLTLLSYPKKVVFSTLFRKNVRVNYLHFIQQIASGYYLYARIQIWQKLHAAGFESVV